MTVKEGRYSKGGQNGPPCMPRPVPPSGQIPSRQISFFKEESFRSREYISWVKSLPSIISGMPAHDAHHIKGRGYGGGVKVSDLMSIPLTRQEHTEFHAMGWKSWEAKYNVDQRDLVLKTIERALREGILK